MSKYSVNDQPAREVIDSVTKNIIQAQVEYAESTWLSYVDSCVEYSEKIRF